MQKIPELINAEKLHLMKKSELSSMLDQIDLLKSQIKTIHEEYDKKIRKSKDLLDAAKLLQSIHLGGWVHSGGKDIYHTRYLLSHTDRPNYNSSKAWLRNMLWRPHSVDLKPGFYNLGSGTWKVTLDYSTPEGARERIVVPGQNRNDWFRNADEILCKAGWILCSDPSQDDPTQEQLG